MREIRRGVALAIAALLPLTQAVANETRHYNLDSQDAAVGLRALALQGDFQVFFPSSLIQGRQLHQVRGEYDAAGALRLALQGTGLTYRPAGEGTYVVEVDRMSGGGAGDVPAVSTYSSAYDSDAVRLAQAADTQSQVVAGSSDSGTAGARPGGQTHAGAGQWPPAGAGRLRLQCSGSEPHSAGIDQECRDPHRRRLFGVRRGCRGRRGQFHPRQGFRGLRDFHRCFDISARQSQQLDSAAHGRPWRALVCQGQFVRWAAVHDGHDRRRQVRQRAGTYHRLPRLGREHLAAHEGSRLHLVRPGQYGSVQRLL